MRSALPFFLIVVLFQCQPKQESTLLEKKSPVYAIKYAEGFTVSDLGEGKKLVTITYPYQGATSGYQYLLVPDSVKIPEHEASVKVIRIPVKTIVCTSTTHIPLLDYLDESARLVGFPSTDYISSEKMRVRIDAGQVLDLGVDKGINLERLAALKPDLVMGYTMSSDYGQFKKIEELGVPAVVNAEYLEKHPLGRAEWIKFMALFFNKEAMADSVFEGIEKNYLETVSLASQVENRPTVMSGVVYGDGWFLPGGENYAAGLFKDAGCQYLWESDSSHGYLNLSFEAVYEKAHDADLWIGVANYSTLQEIKNADNRYTKFKPYRTSQVYTYDGRKGAKGGSEFMELGYLRPDYVLKDLVKIAHPEILPGYTLFFHRKVE